MPELPEVEIARRVIADAIGGARITAVTAEDRLVARGGARAFAPLVGGRVEGVERRGKRLRLAIARGGERLLVFAHLGMSGEWVAAEPGAEAMRFERLRVDAVRGRAKRSLRYLDARRLGRIEVARDDIAAWRELGPDALADGVDVARLHAALAAKRRTVKEALLDQTLLAGVGNIHAIEALWRAGIDPRSRTDALARADVRALARGIRASLAFGLKWQERQQQKYVNAGGANPYRIYGRAGTPCPRCGAKLAKIVLGGRGTTFCPACQRRP